jgi:hypothetical protein
MSVASDIEEEVRASTTTTCIVICAKILLLNYPDTAAPHHAVRLVVPATAEQLLLLQASSKHMYNATAPACLVTTQSYPVDTNMLLLLLQVRRFGPAHRGDFIYSDYAHMDFVWDRNAKHAVDLADVFFRFSPGPF